ncbi:MAG TPA: uracil-DNA glycosylase family protein [Myxococcaceae bacterium]|nr:uracil-DNA glycosylase family protein [Myxococcaceae bacterium]
MRPRAPPSTDIREELVALQRGLQACRACPHVAGTPVHGPPVESRILLVGQAPGPREAALGRPFAWTAGRTLFRWLEDALGVDESTVRDRIYISAVARCFPGKAPGGGDRRPDPGEVERCHRWLAAEVALLAPRLILPVGTLAIERVLGHEGKLAEVVGRKLEVTFAGHRCQAIPLPHPSGASTWHRMEPGKTLLARALQLLAKHPEVRDVFGGAASRTAGLRVQRREGRPNR